MENPNIYQLKKHSASTIEEVPDFEKGIQEIQDRIIQEIQDSLDEFIIRFLLAEKKIAKRRNGRREDIPS